MGLSETIKRRRSELGLTLKDVADRLGVTEATVQRYESGNIKPLRHGRISKLSEILEVTPAELLGYEQQQKEKPATNEDDGLNFNEQDRSVMERFKNLSYENKLKMMGYLDSLSDQDNQ